jgi:hypothetical protein
MTYKPLKFYEFEGEALLMKKQLERQGIKAKYKKVFYVYVDT